MKQQSLGTKLLMILLTLGVVVYFGFQSLLYLDDPLSTTMAYAYQVEEGLELNGYVVRQERVLSGTDNDLLRIQRTEGERVSTGGTVALTYADQASLDRQEEIEDLTAQLENLQYVQESALEGEASLKLDNEIMTEILAFRGAVAAERLDTAEELADGLKHQVLKRDYTYSSSSTEELDTRIAELEAELKELKTQTAGSVKRITAPEAGLYSGIVDGYETVLTPDVLADMTPSVLNQLEPAPEVSSNVGRLVLGDSWYYTAVMTAEEAEDLQKDLQKRKENNQSTNLILRFAKNVERDLTVALDSVGPEENGRCVVTFKGKTYLAQLTLLRQQSAKLIFETEEGIRVPKEAIRAQKTTVDETGEKVVTEEIGIYCLVGMEARFKPVEILYSGENFTLVMPHLQDGAPETIRLRPGDEVILTANDLYDGKVVS